MITAILMIMAGLIVGGGTIFAFITLIPQIPGLIALASTVVAGWGAMSVLQQLPEILKALIGG